MSEIKDTATLEAKALQFYEAGEEMKKLEEEREKLKLSIGQLMKLSEQDEYRFGLDPISDLKITVRDRDAKKVDKEALATDLGVSVSAINLEFLLSMVEQGRLSLQTYQRYVFSETNEQVSIRRVNAD